MHVQLLLHVPDAFCIVESWLDWRKHENENNMEMVLLNFFILWDCMEIDLDMVSLLIILSQVIVFSYVPKSRLLDVNTL